MNIWRNGLVSFSLVPLNPPPNQHSPTLLLLPLAKCDQVKVRIRIIQAIIKTEIKNNQSISREFG